MAVRTIGLQVFERESKLDNGNFEIEVKPEIKDIIDQVLDQLEASPFDEEALNFQPKYELASVQSIAPFSFAPPIMLRKAIPVKLDR